MHLLPCLCRLLIVFYAFFRYTVWHTTFSAPWTVTFTVKWALEPFQNWYLHYPQWNLTANILIFPFLKQLKSAEFFFFFLSFSNVICDWQPALVFENNPPLAVYTWLECGLRPRLGVQSWGQNKKSIPKEAQLTRHIHTRVFCTYSTRKTPHNNKDHCCTYAYNTL